MCLLLQKTIQYTLHGITAMGTQRKVISHFEWQVTMAKRIFRDSLPERVARDEHEKSNRKKLILKSAFQIAMHQRENHGLPVFCINKKENLF